MSDDAWTFFGGPRDGQTVEPSHNEERSYSLIYADTPTGRYIRNDERRRYEWRYWVVKRGETG